MADKTQNEKATKTEICNFCKTQKPKVFRGLGSLRICQECAKAVVELAENKETKPAASVGLSPTYIPSPRELIRFLDQFVVGQERAKKVLSVGVCNHYKRLANIDKHGSVEIDKSNILMIGSTGSGKTYLAKTLSKILNVPFALGNAKAFTDFGYVGLDVNSILTTLLHNSNFNLELCQKGIVYLDEIDKIARKSGENVSITRDVSGEGVQHALLKMIEGDLCDVLPNGGRHHPDAETVKVDTSNILFICGGSFEGLDNIIKKRVGGSGIGFIDKKSENGSKEPTTADLISYGFIPEFCGRLQVRATLDKLDVNTLVNILTVPKNALIKQYQAKFAISNARLEFTDTAIEEIAQFAYNENTGARGLHTILENLLLETQVDLIAGNCYTINRDFVLGKAPMEISKDSTMTKIGTEVA